MLLNTMFFFFECRAWAPTQQRLQVHGPYVEALLQQRRVAAVVRKKM
jgi:hypothetical protein